MGTQGNTTGITAEIVQQNGGIFIELMVDTNNDAVGLLDAWTAASSLNCSVMHDKDGMARAMLQSNGADRDWAFIVDLSTMERRRAGERRRASGRSPGERTVRGRAPPSRASVPRGRARR